MHRKNKKKTSRRAVSTRRTLIAPTTPTLEGETQAIRDLLSAGEDGQWEIGTHYNVIVDRKLAETAGYRFPRNYFSQHIEQIATATLTRYSAVARAFTKSVAHRHGVTRLAQLLTFERLMKMEREGADPGSTVIPITQLDGSLVQKPFAECSFREMEMAIYGVRQSRSAPLPLEERQTIARMDQAVRAAAGTRERAKVTARRAHQVTYLTFERIPIDQVRAVLQAAIDAEEASANPPRNPVQPVAA